MLTRKEKRKERQQNIPREKQSFELKQIDPLTKNQRRAFEAFDNGKNLLLHGTAGTGKSFLSLYLAIRDCTAKNSTFNNVVLVRSVVPTRDMGYLPGDVAEKTAVYEAPYVAMCTELFNRSDAYEILVKTCKLRFISTSFVRGSTFNNAIIVVDEFQNCSGHELNSIITRLGKNCRIIFSGDFSQSDLKYNQKDISNFMSVIKEMNSFSHIEFNSTDICRSNIVKEYIITRDKLGISFI